LTQDIDGEIVETSFWFLLAFTFYASPSPLCVFFHLFQHWMFISASSWSRLCFQFLVFSHLLKSTLLSLINPYTCCIGLCWHIQLPNHSLTQHSTEKLICSKSTFLSFKNFHSGKKTCKLFVRSKFHISLKLFVLLDIHLKEFEDCSFN